MKITEIKMAIPSEFNFVPGVRTCIARIAGNFGFDDREAYHIETVIDEICNNAVEHGARGKDSKIILAAKFKTGEMELTVRDGGGKKFNVEKVFKDNIQSLQERISKDVLEQPSRGRGLIIIQKLVDKLEIKASWSGTTVRIIKKAGNANKNR
jgi:anti-sigma regulatory factor (Ser/Thr protein kinase)